MKNLFIISTIITLAVLLGLHSGCKKSTTATEIQLYVNVGSGVEGTPEAGSQTYTLNDVVDYSYSLKFKYQNLKVSLDGTDIEPSGTITMDKSHTLTVSAEPEPGDFLLSVVVSVGIDGSPETGNFYYNTGETLDYNYTLQDGYVNLRVRLNGEDVPSSGTITFDRAHTLHVFSDKYYEIRGLWNLRETYDDLSFFDVHLTFAGSGTEGTVVDSDGGIGTYTASGPSITFTIEYPEVTYQYTGSFKDAENMTGTSKRIYADKTNNGSWAAQIESAAATAAGQTRQGKSNPN